MKTVQQLVFPIIPRWKFCCCCCCFLILKNAPTILVNDPNLHVGPLCRNPPTPFYWGARGEGDSMNPLHSIPDPILPDSILYSSEFSMAIYYFQTELHRPTSMKSTGFSPRECFFSGVPLEFSVRIRLASSFLTCPKQTKNLQFFLSRGGSGGRGHTDPKRGREWHVRQEAIILVRTSFLWSHCLCLLLLKFACF